MARQAPAEDAAPPAPKLKSGGKAANAAPGGKRAAAGIGGGEGRAGGAAARRGNDGALVDFPEASMAQARQAVAAACALPLAMRSLWASR